MHTLNDLIQEDDFIITAYTEIDAVACTTKGLHIDEFVIKKTDTKDFFFFLRNNSTKILSEIENDLQSLCTKDNRDLLTAMIDINLSIEFATDAMCLCGGFKKNNMSHIFFELLEYLTRSKKLGSNLVAFEGYER